MLVMKTLVSEQVNSVADINTAAKGLSRCMMALVKDCQECNQESKVIVMSHVLFKKHKLVGILHFRYKNSYLRYSRYIYHNQSL